MDRRRNPEAALVGVQRAAWVASQFHTGRFADGAVENVALAVGTELESGRPATTDLRLPAADGSRRRHVLHVTTRAPMVGGHTRMLCHWVRNDQSSRHSVVVLDQQDEPLSTSLVDDLRSSGGHLVSLAQPSLLERARTLRALARQGVDLVVLHQFSWDVVPTVAFAAADGPTVAVLNHADHEFWLGSSVADVVINLRTAGATHALERRFVSRNAVMPVPLEAADDGITRVEARRALGLHEEEPLLLTVGRGVKYRPAGPYDFFATTARILERHPRWRLCLVGETHAGIAPHLRAPVHGRITLVGAVPDPALYLAAADLYLESFPFGSQTALLEACLSGLPVVPAYAPLFPLLVANDDAVNELLSNPASEQEYLDRVDDLIRRPDERERLGAALRARVRATHVGHHWNDQLARVYQLTDACTHHPRPIPASTCLANGADIGLTLRNTMAAANGSYDGTRAVLSHATNVSKVAGHAALARSHAWKAVRHAPRDPIAWRLLLAALLGRVGTVFRRGRAAPWL